MSHLTRPGVLVATEAARRLKLLASDNDGIHITNRACLASRVHVGLEKKRSQQNLVTNTTQPLPIL